MNININNKNKHIKKMVSIIAFTLIFTCFSLFFSENVYVDAKQTKDKMKLFVNQTEYEVNILNHEYDNNIYLSVNDMAKAFNNTDIAFEPVWNDGDSTDKLTLCKISKGTLSFENTNENMLAQDVSADAAKENATVNYPRKKMIININDNDYSFYAIVAKDGEIPDCYINIGEFALSMNIDISIENGSIYVDTSKEFDFRKNDFEESGLPFMADSCLVGDVTTGSIYYSMNEDEQVSIASTTKLMTYLLVMDAMKQGTISSNDLVTFSEKASILSQTGNGVIAVTTGQSANIMDVVKGMLICSSNECALALAEHLAGDEESFVSLMNEKKARIGLSEESWFYDAHGLPVYSEDVLSVKRQNHMTANDMFKLVSYIMETYPEITDITSVKETCLETLNNYVARNTNQLLYNVPGTVGLKTGTTDKAQSCLVSAYKAKDLNDEDHYVVAIVYGAENVQTQSYTSMVLLKYGILKFNEGELGVMPSGDSEDTVPEKLEDMICTVIGYAQNK